MSGIAAMSSIDPSQQLALIHGAASQASANVSTTLPSGKQEGSVARAGSIGVMEDPTTMVTSSIGAGAAAEGGVISGANAVQALEEAAFQQLGSQLSGAADPALFNQVLDNVLGASQA